MGIYAKYITTALILCLFHTLRAQLSFTLHNTPNTNSITCSHTLINLAAQSNFSAPVTYTWTSPQFGTFTTNSISVTGPGNFTIFANSGMFSASQTMAIGINTTIPSVTLTASKNALSCLTRSIVLTALSNPTNVTYYWGQPSPSFDNCSGKTCAAAVSGPYTVTIKDTLNGCQKSSTISIGSKVSYPQFNPIGVYTVACPIGTVSLEPSLITNSATVTFSWDSPSGATTSAINSHSLITNTGGDYTITATDTSNGCASRTLVLVYACVGIEELDFDRWVKLYPNPVSAELFIETNVDSVLRIYDGTGQELVRQQIERTLNRINTNQLSPGIYLLKIGQNTKKIVKVE